VPQAPFDPRIVLNGIDWPTYREISEALTECHVQLTYDRGSLELMTKSKTHEAWSRLLFQLIVVLTDELNLPRASCGSMTCDREDLLRGIEPDECFYIANEPHVRGRPIRFPEDPPPDLAVEIDFTRNSVGRLAIYAAIGVPEVWRYDGNVVTFYRLASGSYVAIDRSEIFPFLTGAAIGDVFQRWARTDETTLVRSFRQWVREQINKPQ
jgi:Uma2 family endonuclease